MCYCNKYKINRKYDSVFLFYKNCKPGSDFSKFNKLIQTLHDRQG